MKLDDLTNAVMEELASAGLGGTVDDTDQRENERTVLVIAPHQGRRRIIKCASYENGCGSVRTTRAKWFGKDQNELAANVVRFIKQQKGN